VSVHPVIMCGGSGTRLWPVSRPSLPKQFIPLIGNRSSFQQTVTRVMGMRDMRDPIIVAGASHAAIVQAQLSALGIRAAQLLEPEPRDTAPAIAAAAVFVADQDPDALLVVLCADHYIPDEAAFQIAASRALIAAEQGWIVTLGVRPNGPSTAFGYIKPAVAALPGLVVHAVEAFVEKPTIAVAAEYIAAGYLWNSGNFISAAARLVAEFDRHAPAISAAARQAVRGGQTLEAGVLLLGPDFAAAPKISIDYAVMEKTDRAAVAPVDFAWSDLGAWDAVKAASPADAHGNSVTGDAVLIDTADCLVRTSGTMRVGLAGVSGLVVIVEPDAVLVSDLASSQAIKGLADSMTCLSNPAEAPNETPAGGLSLAQRASRFDLWLGTNALPLWWALGADHDHGGFHESLEQDGTATGATRRCLVQARQIIVYASAGAAGWPGPWRAAVDHGMRYLLERYRRSDNLFSPLITADGESLDQAPRLYDQAFALLALASAFRHDTERVELLRTAGAVLDRLRVSFAHDQGGFRETGAQPFQSNPLMHLLEAALAWVEAGGGEVWEHLARQIAEHALHRLIDPKRGAIDEIYTCDWAPVDAQHGRIVWPGHQFEWAWLLERWARRSGEPAAHSAAKRLFEIGSAGVDPTRSVVVDAMNYGGAITDPRARLWPQTERLKAALTLATGAESERRGWLVDQATDAAGGLWRYLETPAIGLWRDRMSPDGGFIDEACPASSLYHIVGAVQALSRFGHAGLGSEDGPRAIELEPYTPAGSQPLAHGKDRLGREMV
jgi:mannose-1-phosphate guanylyltransferase/mannose-6-phosphate isomerase